MKNQAFISMSITRYHKKYHVLQFCMVLEALSERCYGYIFFFHFGLDTVKPFYNTFRYNTDLDITRLCCGSQIFFTMDFYKGIIGK